MGIAGNEYDRSLPWFKSNNSNIGNDNSDIKRSEKDDHFVINWIDSKAMFADMTTFEEHLEQLKGYNNRYGRGLVIYWHGFSVEVYSRLRDDMIIVRDSFPDNWVYPKSPLT